MPGLHAPGAPSHTARRRLRFPVDYHNGTMLQSTPPTATAPCTGAPPYLTEGLPGCGGRLRERPEDFVVEEVPAYLPCGHGEHLYLWVEKRGVPTPAVATTLARAMGVSRRAVAFAGRKDARAVTRQWFSVHLPGGAAEPAAALAGSGWRVLHATLHTNKLRLGHLRGNRFTIVVRGAADASGVPAVLERVCRDGAPNYFGMQRLGDRLANARAGRDLLHGGAPRGAARAAEHRRFLIGAYQADLFNALVAMRLRHGGEAPLTLPLCGDRVVLHRNGASFVAASEDLAELRARAQRGELSPSAPLFGSRTECSGGLAGHWEAALLAAEGLTLQSFRKGGKRDATPGAHRPVRVLPADLRWEALRDGGEDCLALDFTLPAGAFATSILRELMKNDDLATLSTVPGA